MQKLLIGVLAVVALFFAAANARLGDRLRVLEVRLRAAEARKRPAPAPAPPPAPVPAPEKTAPVRA